MTELQSNQNEKEIVRNATNIANIKEDIKDIKLEVTNHLPTQIKDLDKRIDGMAIKLAGVVAVVSILVQIAFKLF